MHALEKPCFITVQHTPHRFDSFLQECRPLQLLAKYASTKITFEL